MWSQNGTTKILGSLEQMVIGTNEVTVAETEDYRNNHTLSMPSLIRCMSNVLVYF